MKSNVYINKWARKEKSKDKIIEMLKKDEYVLCDCYLGDNRIELRLGQIISEGDKHDK